MSPVLLGGGLVLFVLGLVAVFARSGLRGRVVGLGLMALGALVAVAAADPHRPATWVMVATSAATLVGLLAFAVVLGRRAAARTGDVLRIDDDPMRWR